MENKEETAEMQINALESKIAQKQR